jgi:phospholipase C
VAGSMGNRNSGQTMAFSNMQKGEVPYLKSLADQYAMSDNYHQQVMGGTGPEPLVRVGNFSPQ